MHGLLSGIGLMTLGIIVSGSGATLLQWYNYFVFQSYPKSYNILDTWVTPYYELQGQYYERSVKSKFEIFKNSN